MPQQTERPRTSPSIDLASQKLLEWDAKAVDEKRHGKFAIEATYIEGKLVLIRELIDLTTK